MSLALVGVAAAACCSGAATILQARAARDEPAGTGLDAGLLVRLLRRPTYLGALTLVAAGFALSFLALRTLPLFVVQAGRASSLAVAAVLAALVLRARLSRIEVGAVVAVGGGVLLLGLAAGPSRTGEVPAGTRIGLLIALVAIAAAAAAVGRRGARAHAGVALGALAGAAFAILALGARILRSTNPAALVADPAAWAIAGGGALGLLLTATALQRTSVVGATAPMVAIETVLGSALGMLLCGDRPAAGTGLASALGFALVLAGALSLTRFAAPAAANADPATGPAPQ
ncbi:hypothetical protein [Pengzhenrongella sicca]|uniref:Integral membrane protein n=1 Tax=Pengzhenrongella sicca TaxID=2819238 RepID=A0A8A4ZE54_9MICO|nr:hypothetical protein [Pengzhenrongella sicca]QTE30270.1 hypothetical protein J4E96_04485 [Pengzhenrongella sicca]